MGQKRLERYDPGTGQRSGGYSGPVLPNAYQGELLQLAIENRFQIGPCNDAEDVLNHPQLEARNFWKEIEHPELGTSLKYPGGAVQSHGDIAASGGGPLIGEHNAEIYQKELGMSAKQIQRL